MNSKAAELLEDAIELLILEEEIEAIEKLDEVIALEPSCAIAYLKRANGKLELRRFADALEDYEKVLEFGQEEAAASLGKGVCLMKRMEFSSAFDALKRALELNGESASAHYWFGRANYELKHYEAAFGELNRAIELQPAFTEALAFRGLVELKLAPPEPPSSYDLFSPDNEYEFSFYRDAHPLAREILDLPFFWSSDDYSPLGGDIGFEIREDLWSWRLYNAKASMKNCLRELFICWGYDSKEIRQIANSNPDHCVGTKHLIANVHDDVVIAVAFVQFMVDGYLDKYIKQASFNAIDRQLSPKVLEFRAGDDENYIRSRNLIRDALRQMPTN